MGTLYPWTSLARLPSPVYGAQYQRTASRTFIGQLLDTGGLECTNLLKVLALPSGAPKSRDYKDIVKGLGKSGGIDLQGVSVALPKQLVPEDEDRDDGPETRRPATANGRPDRKNIISSINISRKAKPEQAETTLAAAMRAAMARKAVRV